MAPSHIALRPWATRQGEDNRAAPCDGFFPLTPALSLGERVNSTLRRVQSRHFDCSLRDARCSLSLRERVRVRGNGAATILRLGPFSELSHWARPPVEPRVSIYDYDRDTNMCEMRRRSVR